VDEIDIGMMKAELIRDLHEKHEVGKWCSSDGYMSENCLGKNRNCYGLAVIKGNVNDMSEGEIKTEYAQLGKN